MQIYATQRIKLELLPKSAGQSAVTYIKSLLLIISSASEKFNTWSPLGMGWTEEKTTIKPSLQVISMDAWKYD
jgi:hypothetical protein